MTDSQIGMQVVNLINSTVHLYISIADAVQLA